MHAAVPVYLFDDNIVWRAVFWASFVAFFFVAGWVSRREGSAKRGDKRDRFSRPLIYVFSLLAYGAAFAGPSVFPEARIAFAPELVFVIAIALFWIGLLLYVWAVLTLGAFFRTSVQLLDGQRLVTAGPYRLVRHPAYTGGIVLFAGIGLAMGNWASLIASTLLVAIAYAWRIRIEEAALRERFGAEFEAQRRRTWAVIPLLW